MDSVNHFTRMLQQITYTMNLNYTACMLVTFILYVTSFRSLAFVKLFVNSTKEKKSSGRQFHFSMLQVTTNTGVNLKGNL